MSRSVKMAKTAELIPATNGPILRPWRELAILAYIWMELSWVTLFYRALFTADKAVPYGRALVILCAMLLVSYVFTRATEMVTLKTPLRWGLLAAVFLASELTGARFLIQASRFHLDLQEFLNRPADTLNELNNLVPAEFLLLVLVFWAWWRGISLVSKQAGPHSVISGFRTGIVAFFVYGLVFPLAGQGPVILALGVFVFSSLLAMSAARITVQSQMRGGQRIPFNRYWLAGILLAVSATAALSVLAAEAMRARLFNLVSLVYSWALYTIAILLGPLLLLFMQLIFSVGRWLNFAGIFTSFLEFLAALQENLQKLLKSLVAIIGNQNSLGLEQVFRFILSLRYLVFWLGILLAVLIVLFTLQRQVWKREIANDQQTEDILEKGDLIDLLRSALRRSLSRAAAGLESALRLNRAGNLLAAARIRRIYARVLNISAQLGRPRPAPSTPLEFLPKLEQLFPDQKAELGTITRAYLQVRYGERSESRVELEVVETAWKRIRAEAKIQLGANKRKRS